MGPRSLTLLSKGSGRLAISTVAQARRSDTRYSSSSMLTNCRSCRGSRAFFTRPRASVCPASGPPRSASTARSLLPTAVAVSARLCPVRCTYFPLVESGFTDAELATYFRYRRASFHLFQGKDDLRFGELGFLHGNCQAPILS